MTIPSSVYQTSKIAEDQSASKNAVDHSACLRAGMRSGKNIFKQMWEYLRMSRTPGHLVLNEYFMYQLYDDERYTFEEKCQFVSDTFYHQTITKCCDPRWWILADDKFWSYTILSANGIPVPETVAAICTGPRIFGNVTNLTNTEETRQFFEDNTEYPLYCKPVHGIGSFGNYLIQGYQDAQLRLHDDSTLPLDDFMNQIDTSNGQLLQKLLKPHPDLSEINERVSTIRVILIIRNGEIEIVSTVWKIPSAGNIADNFWRAGNMLASVDIESGEVVRVVGYKDGIPQELESDSPKSEQLLGLKLPDWERALDLCRQGARHFAPLKFQSWDIGLTENGPVVVELNPGSSFILPQLAEGRGFLTDDFLQFLRDCGCKLKDRK